MRRKISYQATPLIFFFVILHEIAVDSEPVAPGRGGRSSSGSHSRLIGFDTEFRCPSTLRPLSLPNFKSVSFLPTFEDFAVHEQTPKHNEE